MPPIAADNGSAQSDPEPAPSRKVDKHQARIRIRRGCVDSSEKRGCYAFTNPLADGRRRRPVWCSPNGIGKIVALAPYVTGANGAAAGGRSVVHPIPQRRDVLPI